jgi:hypothetical protein
VGEATGDFKNVDNTRLDILTEALMISVFLWYLTPCRLMYRYRTSSSG